MSLSYSLYEYVYLIVRSVNNHTCQCQGVHVQNDMPKLVNVSWSAQSAGGSKVGPMSRRVRSGSKVLVVPKWVQGLRGSKAGPKWVPSVGASKVGASTVEAVIICRTFTVHVTLTCCSLTRLVMSHPDTPCYVTPCLTHPVMAHPDPPCHAAP